MRKMSRLFIAGASLSVLLAAVPAFGFGVNSSVKIDSGSEASGDSTVNGSISVGSNAVVNGSLETVNGTIRIDDSVQLVDASTVNGSIRIGDGVIADDIESVNGTIRVGRNATISGEVAVVNGKIHLSAGSSVAGDVSNVNGELRIVGSEIGGGMSTVSGDVWLTDNSTLQGDLVIEKPGGWGRIRSKPKIVIGPGSRVLGKIDAEHDIELYISDTAEVGEVTGNISIDQAIRFSGSKP